MIRARIIIALILISFALSILPFPPTASSDSRISCGGSIVGMTKSTTSTDWILTIAAISGSGQVPINTTYLAVWTAEGKLTVSPATLDKFESQPSIDSRVRYLANSNLRIMTPGDDITFNRTAFAAGLTMRLLTAEGEQWSSGSMAQVSFGDANASQLDPLPSLVNYNPAILTIVLVALTALSIWIAELKWKKFVSTTDPEKRLIAFTKWMPVAFIIGGVSLSVLGFYSFPSGSVGMMLYSFPSRSLLFFTVILIAPILSWFAASYEYSKWKREIAASWSFRSYLLLSVVVSIISIVTFAGFFTSGIGGPAC